MLNCLPFVDSETVTVGKAAGGILDKLRSLYASRDNISDAWQALIYAVILMLVAIGLSVCVNHYHNVI